MQNLAQFQQDLYKIPNYAKIQKLISSRNSGEVIFPISAADAHEQMYKVHTLLCQNTAGKHFFTWNRQSVIKHL